jgi:hypothetical protein
MKAGCITNYSTGNFFNYGFFAVRPGSSCRSTNTSLLVPLSTRTKPEWEEIELSCSLK